jgi:hypothetical protein
LGAQLCLWISLRTSISKNLHLGPSKWPRKLKPAKNSKLPKWPENCFEPFGKGGWPLISTWIRGGNQQVKLISIEPLREDPRVIVITIGGIVRGEDRVTPGNMTEESRIRRVAGKMQLFDSRKEKKTFEEARREFGREHASSSKSQIEVKECGIPLAFD